MSEPSPAERKLFASYMAHRSWAQTDDRTKRTSNGRAAFEQRFLTEANGDPVKAEHLRKAFYQKMALKSAESRRKRAAS